MTRRPPIESPDTLAAKRLLISRARTIKGRRAAQRSYDRAITRYNEQRAARAQKRLEP
jgi:hypothetical protein